MSLKVLYAFSIIVYIVKTLWSKVAAWECIDVHELPVLASGFSL